MSEPAAGRRHTAPVEPRTRIPIVYVKDAVGALIALADAPTDALTHRTFGRAGVSPSAGEIADAVRAVVRDAEIDFAPDHHLLAIVDTWPREISGDAALAEVGRRNRSELPLLVNGLAHQERELVTRSAARPA